MVWLRIIFVFILAYLIGSIPAGLFIVKFLTGKDVRKIESGRTGGTNVMRAAGFWAGFATSVIDVLKGVSAVYLAKFFIPGNEWVTVLAPVIAVIGHNYSIFLSQRDETGKFILKGGAGGATALGGSIGLWLPIFWIIGPVALFLLFVVGIASLATMSIPTISIIVFAIRGYLNESPMEYVLYGVLSLLLILWALRPNIKRLFEGTERVVGFRAKRSKNADTTNQQE